MRADRLALLIAALGLAGCDRITGADQQKIFDAEAIGYACRISLKTPEDCMKENESMSPTSILSGWKAANKDVENEIIDPSMGKNPPAPPAPVTPEAAPPAVPAAAGKGTEKPAEKTAEKPAEKPAGKAPAH
ncbi:MAG: hypothetical protein A2Z95_05140 [Gallionellales bacterium GWA2_60_18]|nr:MAG: hypothetical protein A2Z95_05140 [Gallionellales bacterium GWA2_60_18]